MRGADDEDPPHACGGEGAVRMPSSGAAVGVAGVRGDDCARLLHQGRLNDGGRGFRDPSAQLSIQFSGCFSLKQYRSLLKQVEEE